MTDTKKALGADLLGELVALFGEMESNQRALVEIIRAKTDAMRRADLEALRSLDMKELRRVEQLQAHEETRRKLLDRIGDEAGLTLRVARTLTVTHLATWLAEPQRQRLLRATTTLREVAAQLARVNRIAGTVTRELTNHLSWALCSIRPQGLTPVGYSGDGVPVSMDNAPVIEAMG